MAHYQMKEKQTKIQIDQILQQKIQYYVFQDLENFLGILTEVLETLKFFEKNMNNDYVPVSIERFLIQTNISNTMLVSFEEAHKQLKNYDQFKLQFKQTKEEAKKIFHNTLNNEQIERIKNNSQINECVNQYLDLHLSEKNELQIKNIPHHNQTSKAQFTIEQATQVFDGQDQVRQANEKIKNKQYTAPSQKDIVVKLQQRAKQARDSLEKNFVANPINSQFQMNQEQNQVGGANQHLTGNGNRIASNNRQQRLYQDDFQYPRQLDYQTNQISKGTRNEQYDRQQRPQYQDDFQISHQLNYHANQISTGNRNKDNNLRQPEMQMENNYRFQNPQQQYQQQQCQLS